MLIIWIVWIPCDIVQFLKHTIHFGSFQPTDLPDFILMPYFCLELLCAWSLSAFMNGFYRFALPRNRLCFSLTLVSVVISPASVGLYPRTIDVIINTVLHFSQDFACTEQPLNTCALKPLYLLFQLPQSHLTVVERGLKKINRKVQKYRKHSSFKLLVLRNVMKSHAVPAGRLSSLLSSVSPLYALSSS